jgi:hypothetical protein
MSLYETWQTRILKVILPRGRVWGVSVWVIRQPVWDDFINRSEPVALTGYPRKLIWD